jgi:hypothetical protein
MADQRRDRIRGLAAAVRRSCSSSFFIARSKVKLLQLHKTLPERDLKKKEHGDKGELVGNGQTLSVSHRAVSKDWNSNNGRIPAAPPRIPQRFPMKQYSLGDREGKRIGGKKDVLELALSSINLCCACYGSG